MMAVRQVSAMREIQSKDGIAGLQNRGIGFHVGLRSGMRLHVGVLGAEQLLRPVARQILDDIGKLAAAVVAFSGVSLGVFVRKDRACSFQDSFTDKIL